MQTTIKARPAAAVLAGAQRPSRALGTPSGAHLRNGFLSGSPISPQQALRRAPASTRSAGLRVEASLFGRISRLGRSYTFFYGDKAVKKLEDPTKLLDQAVKDMAADLARMKQASSQVLATQRMLEDKAARAKNDVAAWNRRAEVALRAGEEELAREALRRRKTAEATAAMLEKQLEQHNKAYSGLIGSVRALEQKVTQAQSKKETLKARAMSAEAAKMLNDEVAGILGGLSSSANNSLAAFARMEERVMAMEAEAEASVDSALLFASPLESKFLALEGDTVEDELLKLKTEMAGEGSLQRGLPERAQGLRGEEDAWRPPPRELQFPERSRLSQLENDISVTWR